jgi:hypothetical protein
MGETKVTFSSITEVLGFSSVCEVLCVVWLVDCEVLEVDEDEDEDEAGGFSFFAVPTAIAVMHTAITTSRERAMARVWFICNFF